MRVSILQYPIWHQELSIGMYFNNLSLVSYSIQWGKVGLIRTSGKVGHTFSNSVNPDETAPYEPSHQDFHCLLS